MRSSRVASLARPLWAAALTVVIVGTLMPAEDMPPTPDLSDKLLHFAAYLVLATLGVIGWPELRYRLPFGLILLGFALEVMQGTLVPGRHFDWFDALANAAGAGLVLAATTLLTDASRPR